MINETMVTTPPDVVLTLASSTVFVNASKRVKRDLAGMTGPTEKPYYMGRFRAT